MREKSKNTFIFWILYLAYTSIYIARVNLSVAGPELIGSGVMDSAQLGTLGSCFFVIYALGRIANGILGDKLPPWVMLSTGLFVAAAGNLLFALFPPYWAMILFWGINAYAQSMLWSSVLCAVTAMYDPITVKKKTSLMVTSVATGNILGIVLDTALISRLGVRCAFVIPGAITALFGVLSFVFVRKIRAEKTETQKHQSFFALLKNKELFSVNITAFIHGIMKENISLWMAVYVVDTFLVDLTTSSFYILMIPLVGLCGRLVYPLLYRVCKNREHRVSFVGFCLCVLFSLILCVPRGGIVLSVFSLSMIYMAVSLINTSLLSIYPLSFANSGNTASVSGLLDFSTYFGAGISGMIYGAVIQYFGYVPMFFSWIVLSVISLWILRKRINCNIKCP